jgi:Trk K+ transport system NAD-binding subunit
MNRQASVVARARNENNVEELLGAGATRVMVPELAGAQALLNASIDSLSIPH